MEPAAKLPLAGEGSALLCERHKCNVMYIYIHMYVIGHCGALHPSGALCLRGVTAG